MLNIILRTRFSWLKSSPQSLIHDQWYRSMHILLTHHVNNWWTDVFFYYLALRLWCFQFHLHPLCVTHTLLHTFIIRQLFPSQSQTAIGSLSTLPIFHVSLFPAESITSGILSHEQTGLSVIASKHFNFFGLLFSLGSALDETVVYVYVFCVYVFGLWMCAEGVLTD